MNRIRMEEYHYNNIVKVTEHFFPILYKVRAVYAWTNIDMLILFRSLVHNVIVNGHKVLEYLATSGVPQGSNLCSFLFNVFINDIIKVIDFKCLLYADDLKMLFKIENTQDCRHIRQYNLWQLECLITFRLMQINTKLWLTP